MEAFAVLVGFLILVAFGLALIGVPILFSRIKVLTSRVVLLEQRLAAQASRTVVDAPALTTPVVDLGEAKSEGVETGSSEASVPSADVQSKPIVEPNIETPETDDSENFVAKKMKASWASPQKTVIPVPTTTAEPASALSKEDGLGSQLVKRLLAMNITAQVGGIVLIFGAIFLGKYASDIGLLTLQAKLILMAFVSVALVAAGSIFQKRLQVYADVLQGTGFAGWLVTLFVAHVLYEQMHWLVTLIAGVCGVIYLGYRALKQDSQPLAMVAFLGGFLTPFIASSEVSSLWRLFAYLSVLNVAVVGTALFKPWRWLVREAYVASFGLLSLLMLAEYLQHDLNRLTTQLPMAMFIGLTLMAFSVLAWRWLATEKMAYVKHASGLLFGVPAAATLALQALFHHQSLFVSLGLVLAATWYGALYYLSQKKTLLVIAIVMASAAVPYALSDSLTSLVYSIEGAAFAYWAIRFNKRSSLIWGGALQLVAAVFVFKLFQSVEARESQLYVSWVLNGAVFVAALASAWWLRKYQQPFTQWARSLETAALVWALFVWLAQWAFWLAETFSRQFTLWYLAWVIALSLIIVFVSASRLNWRLLASGVRVLAVLFVATGLLYLTDYAHDASMDKLLLLAVLASAVFALRLFQSYKIGPLADWDALVTWFGLPFVASLALFFSPQLQTDWNLTWLFVLPIALSLFLRSGLRLFFRPSPVRAFSRWLSLGILFLLTLSTLGQLGNYAPLPYWPIVHPLMIACLIAAESLFRYIRRHRVLRLVWVVWLGAVVTVELNRWLFHYAGVPFDVASWLDSALTQTVWSIVWTLLGGILMITAARISFSRSRWVVGAVVLGIIVLKMFVLDLAQVDTLYRILSFLGVGSLLLAIGYFAPMPTNGANLDPQLKESENGAIEGNER